MDNITVIIPTYNRAKLIQQAIDSVVAQTYSNWELFVVDDFSNDNTEDTVSNLILKQGNTKIKYIKNEGKKGVSGARNTGMKHAKGKYIAFLDSDDFWAKDNLKVKIEILDRDPSIDMLLSDSHFFGETGEDRMPAPYIHQLFQDKFWDRRDAILSIARNSVIPYMLKNGFPFRIQSLVFKKELLPKVEFFNENMIYCEDADFIFKCFCAGKTGYLHKKLCHIRRHALNTPKIYSKNVQAESDMLLVKSVIGYTRKFNLSIDKAVLKRVLRDAYIRRATSWLRDGQLEEARKCILESIRTKFCIKAFMRLLGLYMLYFLPKNIKNMLLQHFRVATLSQDTQDIK